MSSRDDWQRAFEQSPRRDADFATMSGLPVEPVYGPDDAEFPGLFPFTRGPYASMYRSKPWTMRMFAGFGTAVDTNRRFHDLLTAGGEGLSTAFDLPTLMGRDSDDELALGEVGRCGVAVDTLADVEDLYRGIDLGAVTTSMTINGPAAVILAMYVANAESTGVERARLGGTLQNDILKEYQAQKEFIFPPRPSLRLVADTMRFCTAEQPEVNIVRTAIEALAGVLGGTQSLHTNSMDETLALPTERAARIALRTQQVIASESRVANVADPLGGSWYVEALTDEMERRANELFDQIEELGNGSMLEGAIQGVEEGWYQGEIADSAYELERKLNAGRHIVVGVNGFLEGSDEPPPPIMRIGPEVEEEQRRRLDKVRRERDSSAVAAALARVRTLAAEPDVNLMPAFIEAARAYATLGEIIDALGDVFGRWVEAARI